MIERARIVDGVPRLVGARCLACGHTTFPRRERCPACRTGETEESALGPDATVESVVTLHVSTEEAKAPYAIGMVALDGGPTVLARVDAAQAGERVQLVVEPERDVFWFASAPQRQGAPR